MKWIIAVFWLLFTTSVCGEDRERIKGLWASDGSIFHIFEKDGVLHSVIVALKEPHYTREEDAGRAGQQRVDDENPEKALRSRPILGLEMFSDYRYEKQKWKGKIYDPEPGNTYQSRIALADDGRLEIRGYIGLPMFGRTAQFDPASSCKAHIVEMLKMTDQGRICE